MQIPAGKLKFYLGLVAAAGAVGAALISGTVSWIVATQNTETTLSVTDMEADAAVELEKTKAQAAMDLSQETARGTLELEKLKLETTLIIKALETVDQQEAVKRLRFFAKAGLIPTHEDRVLALVDEDDGKQVPALNADYVPASMFRVVDFAWTSNINGNRMPADRLTSATAGKPLGFWVKIKVSQEGVQMLRGVKGPPVWFTWMLDNGINRSEMRMPFGELSSSLIDGLEAEVEAMGAADWQAFTLRQNVPVGRVKMIVSDAIGKPISGDTDVSEFAIDVR